MPKNLLAAVFMALQPALCGLTELSVPVVSNGQNNIVLVDGLTVTTRLVLPSEYQKRFYPLSGAKKEYRRVDLNAENIYPVALSITNNTDQAMVFTMPQPSIANAHILTAATLHRLIGFNGAVTMGSLFLCFPLFFVFAYNAVQLEKLVPLITRYGFNADEVIVQPQETYNTMLFVQLSYVRKEGEKKLEKPVLPNRFDMIIPLVNCLV